MAGDQALAAAQDIRKQAQDFKESAKQKRKEADDMERSANQLLVQAGNLERQAMSAKAAEDEAMRRAGQI